MAGVTLSAPQARFAWQAWHFQDLHRCLPKRGTRDAAAVCRGRRGTCSTSGSICAAGSVAPRTPSWAGWRVAGVTFIQAVELHGPKVVAGASFHIQFFLIRHVVDRMCAVSNWASSSLYFDERTFRYHKLILSQHLHV